MLAYASGMGPSLESTMVTQSLPTPAPLNSWIQPRSCRPPCSVKTRVDLRALVFSIRLGMIVLALLEFSFCVGPASGLLFVARGSPLTVVSVCGIVDYPQ